MGKTSIGLLIAVLLVPSVCMGMTLAPVTLKSDCGVVFGTTTGFDKEGTDLLGLLGTFIEGLPSYAVADLENAANGDGVPDSYQLALLGAAICEGNSALLDQFNTNRGKINYQLLQPLTQAAGMLFGTQGLVTKASQLSADLRAWAVAPIPGELISGALAIADAIDGALADINGVLTPEVQGYVNLALPLLAGYVELAAGLIGLDTEIGTIISTYVTPDVLQRVSYITAQINTVVVPAMNQLVATAGPSGANLLTANLVTELNAVAGILTPAAVLIDQFAAFAANPGFEIYGVGAKSASEPFAAAGDYNGDGISNLQVYNDLKGAGAGALTRENFVAAASGHLQLWPGRSKAEGVPVAGVVGMAFLAGIVALGGALSIRKK